MATTVTTTIERAPEARSTPSTLYSWTAPAKEPALKPSDHFSSLLFGGSVTDTVLELVFLLVPLGVVVLLGDAQVSVAGSMPLSELTAFFWVAAITRRVYNAYLEACWFAFPLYRTQPPKEHSLKRSAKDLCGREQEQLSVLAWHDKMTMLSQFALNFGIYYALPGFYPAAGEPSHHVSMMMLYGQRLLRLLLNHYVMSFGMYWAHRSLHEVKFLWRHIHSIHHWARHPLSRNTYEDHWADNFGNAIVGHVFAQILVPLDNPTFWFSRLLRIMESLEKHSGISCHLNVVHSCQRWLPFAQMPHHHDWHHEGHKGCNYTFTSIGGAWDCLFGTRKAGRFEANGGFAATSLDKSPRSGLTFRVHPCLPVVMVACLAMLKLARDGAPN